MTKFSSSKIITHCFHVENAQGDARIGYNMIIGCDLMVQLGLKANFESQILEWDEAVIFKKYQGNFLGQYDLTKHNIREVVM